MKKIIVTILCMGLCLMLSSAVNLNNMPLAEFTVHVQDEQGNPVANANASFGFTDPDHIVWADTRLKPVIKTTDSNGNATASGYTIGRLACSVEKEGYYGASSSKVLLKEVDALNHWLPWNQTYSVILFKIINPVPMYAKNVDIEIPVTDTPVGFDLTAADWVSPWGKGVISDVNFVLNKNYKDINNYKGSLSLTFVNPADGLIEIPEQDPKTIGSDFQFPRYGPLDGYIIHQLTILDEQTPNGGIHDRPKVFGYFMRIRSVVDKNGNILHALYGKMPAHEFMGGSYELNYYDIIKPHARIKFTYYLNPDGTNNLEFDTKKNLLKFNNSTEPIRYP